MKVVTIIGTNIVTLFLSEATTVTNIFGGCVTFLDYVTNIFAGCD